MAGASPAAAQGVDGKPRIAVVEFAVVDASAAPDVAAVRARLAASGKSTAGWLAQQLDSIGRYTVTSTASISVPADCQDTACAAELGRTLDASRVVVGRVSKFSNLIWFLSATLVNVPAARVIDHEEFEVKGDITDLLPRATLALARRLVTADSARLTREQVLAMLAAATPERPANLAGRDLSGLDLSQVDFKRADLTRARLAGTNLSGARLFAVTLTDAVATGADLHGANLDVAVLSRVDLRNANLQGASLFATILSGADLTAADLTGARVIATLDHAKLSRATLVRANLGADPGNQPMGVMRTDATDAQLLDADLRGANLRKVNFTRAVLRGANLADADITGADLGDADLRGVRGREALRGLDRALNVDRAHFND